MSEKTKIYIVFGVLIALIVIIIGYNYKLSSDSKKIYANFEEVLNSTEQKIVLIGRQGCSWCQLYRPILDYYAEKYDISYTYIDSTTLIDRDLTKILDKASISIDEFGTPLTLFVKDGIVSDLISGYVDERELLEKLQSSGLVDEEETIALNYLDFSQFKKTIKSKKRSIIVMGQTQCSYCISFKPILMGIADNKEIDINYINVDEINSTESEEFDEYLSNFKEFDDFGTPLTIVVEDGKIIDSLSGYSSEDSLIKFLQQNNLLKD